LPVYKLLARIQLQFEHHQTFPLETTKLSILIFGKLRITLRTFIIKAVVVVNLPRDCLCLWWILFDIYVCKTEGRV